MSDTNYFVIENGILKKYTGKQERVVVPDYVTSIAHKAFYFCGNLTTVEIPRSVTSIEHQPFVGCRNLQAINVDAENHIFSSEKGVLFNKEKTTLIVYPEGKSVKYIIPDGVTKIGYGAFSNCSGITAITLADSVTSIDNYAFLSCGKLSKIVLSANLRSIGDYAFAGCSELSSITLPASLETIGKKSLDGWMSTKKIEIRSSNLRLPDKKLSIFNSQPLDVDSIDLFAPHLSLSVLSAHGLATPAVKTFLGKYNLYDEEITKEYINYISAQRKNFLICILESDNSPIIQKLSDSGKITKNNFEKEYFLPAKQMGAVKCEKLLTDIFGAENIQDISINPLWDGTHFSFDGKTLLKYKDNPEINTYYVPEGTNKICTKAFFMPKLNAVYLPESITTIQDGAFVAKGGSPLYIKLPDSLKNLPHKAFLGEFWDEDDSLVDYKKYYYIETTSAEFAEKSSCSNLSRGEQSPVYTGGPLDDLAPKTKSFAVKGFLYAKEHNKFDMSPWEDSYYKYISENQKKYVKLAEESVFLLNTMLEQKLLSKNNVKKLIDVYSKRRKSEIVSSLVDYENNLPPKK